MRPLAILLLTVIMASFACKFNHQQQAENEAMLRKNLTHIREVLDQYFSDKGKFPGSLDDLVKDGYLPDVPIDPFTGRNDTWVAIYEDLGANPDPKAKQGIWDVKSGSSGEGSGGIPYQEL